MTSHLCLYMLEFVLYEYSNVTCLKCYDGVAGHHSQLLHETHVIV